MFRSLGKSITWYPSPEFLSFALAQLEILPSPTRGEGSATPGVKPVRFLSGEILNSLKIRDKYYLLLLFIPHPKKFYAFRMTIKFEG